MKPGLVMADGYRLLVAHSYMPVSPFPLMRHGVGMILQSFWCAALIRMRQEMRSRQAAGNVSFGLDRMKQLSSEHTDSVAGSGAAPARKAVSVYA